MLFSSESRLVRLVTPRSLRVTGSAPWLTCAGACVLVHFSVCRLNLAGLFGSVRIRKNSKFRHQKAAFSTISDLFLPIGIVFVPCQKNYVKLHHVKNNMTEKSLNSYELTTSKKFQDFSM